MPSIVRLARSRTAWAAGIIAALLATRAGAGGNLLRNSRFQDDWITMLPELKNHNWNYSAESYNRRDYNPDCWNLKGSWDWQNPEAPRGQRRLVLRGPKATAAQQVNWCGVHNPDKLDNFPDAGGYPTFIATTSRAPERLVRDLTLRVRISARDVPSNAAAFSLQFLPEKKKGPAPAIAYAPAGTYEHRWIELGLPAEPWLRSAATNAGASVDLPTLAGVGLAYTGATGQLELEEAELSAAAPDAPNLLANGGFEEAGADGYPAGWSPQLKYRYFPPRYYYIFNTWHNASFDNRGPVAADALCPHAGRRSLRMVVPPGDEKCVVSAPVILNQSEPRLIEVSAWIRTDKLALMQIDGLDEDGKRLDAYNFIHKVPPSIGSDEWRLIRQIFRPRKPLRSLRLQLCARGVNGYTLSGTGSQPQCTVVGTIWWDDVRVYEPETPAAELAARKVKPVDEPKPDAPAHPVLASLDPGERMLGENVLRATLTNSASSGDYALQWEFTSPAGRKTRCQSAPVRIARKAGAVVEIPYTIDEPCPAAYTEYRGALALLDGKGRPIASSELWFGVWTTPIDLELGNAYLTPGQTHNLVRMNFGLTPATMARAATVRLDVIRKATGKVLHSATIAATPPAIAAQREKIPADLREDFRNLLVADVDITSLPLMPFRDPQRNWLIRATLLDAAGQPMAAADSAPFCRLDYPAKQPAIETVTIDTNNLLYVNGQPWLAWGVTYGHNPVYDGPADPGPGKYRDLHDLGGWNLYDRHGSRSTHDLRAFNCSRYVAGSITPLALLERTWTNANVYASSAFAIPGPAFSLEDLTKLAGGPDKLDAYLAFTRTSPMVVSLAPGIEETFACFQTMPPAQQAGLKQVADYLREKTRRPVMVGHGGYWNRLEFEKATFFDIFDPETEPLYPANVHTDLMPLIGGQAKVAWLRPQMYEPVPYERWRFHTWVEMMRGARGWQIAHGPADPSLFRGLRAEMEYITPALYSKDPGPAIAIEPAMEHWSRRAGGKTTIVAATTHGLTMGLWRWVDDTNGPTARVRETGSPGETRLEDNAYGIGQNVFKGPSLHSIQYLPDARAWPAGSRLRQWVKVDPQAAAKNLVLIAKADGRWIHAASWGRFDAAGFRSDLEKAHWFLRAMYRHASGFLGWDASGTAGCLEYVIGQTLSLGDVPADGDWVRLEVPLDAIGAANQLLDGVAFMHEDGRVWWGRTSIVAPDGRETVVLGDSIGLAPAALARTRITVAGLKAGTKVRVAFEDREIVAEDGGFTDDFRGQDLYERHGGGPYGGYGDTPVALHVYEVPL